MEIAPRNELMGSSKIYLNTYAMRKFLYNETMTAKIIWKIINY